MFSLAPPQTRLLYCFDLLYNKLYDLSCAVGLMWICCNAGRYNLFLKSTTHRASGDGAVCIYELNNSDKGCTLKMHVGNNS